MKPGVRVLKRKSYISVQYLDDKLRTRETYEICLRNVQQSTTLLEWLGFLVNREKSKLNVAIFLHFLRTQSNIKQ